MVSFLLILFWFCLFLVFYTYIGYGVLIFVLVKIKEMFVAPLPVKSFLEEELPDVTIFITAYNEEDVVNEKMKNTSQINYPNDKLRILWVTDGSIDNTNKKLEVYTGITVLFEPERKGKTAAINRGMKFVDTPYVIFTDANSMINSDAVLRIISFFSDSKVGCVSGEKRILAAIDDDLSSKGENTYWKYESILKSLDSRFYTTVGAAGELYGIRTELYEPVPNDTLLDDFMLSMRIAQKGYRIAYTKDAYAEERGTLNMEEEGKRKKRITAGGWQSIIRLSELFNVFKYGRLGFQYISHRVLRWSLAPVALFLLLPINLMLYFSEEASSFLYGFTLLFQLLFYLSAFIGYLNLKKEKQIKLFYIPYYFVFMNVNVFKGLIYLFKNRGNAVWEKSARH